MTDEQEEEQHWHDRSGLDGGCLQCEEGLRESLATDLLNAMGPLIRAGRVTSPSDLWAVVRALNSIFDEWPR